VSHPPFDLPYDLTSTGTGMPLHQETHLRPAPPSGPVAVPAPTRPDRPSVVTALAVGAAVALLATAVSVFLPWHDVGPASGGIAGSAFGIGVLVVSVALLATVVVDVLEGRTRWSAAVAAPGLALLAVLAASTVAALISGVSVSTQLALAGIPWPGPVVSGAGVWIFYSAQLVCIVLGAIGAVGWLKGWGDPDPQPSASPRRPVILALCAVAAVVLVLTSGAVLAARTPPAAATAVTGGR
jgi:hypothetical protein